jgi:uncharacterized membrane protein YhaH (DUF805 family)
MLKLHEGRYSKVSFLALFIALFIVISIVIFGISQFSGLSMPYGELLLQTVIFSTMIALLIASCCFFARGGTRDPKEITDGHTVLGI